MINKKKDTNLKNWIKNISKKFLTGDLQMVM